MRSLFVYDLSTIKNIFLQYIGSDVSLGHMVIFDIFVPTVTSHNVELAVFIMTEFILININLAVLARDSQIYFSL